MSRNRTSLTRVVVSIPLLVSIVALLPARVDSVEAESYSISIGETFYYDSCWSGVGTSARLERKVPGTSVWRQVAKARPVRSDQCDSGYKLVSYKWKPKTVGKVRLRESVVNSYGSKRTYSKSFVLDVVDQFSNDMNSGSSELLPSLSGGGGSSSSGSKLLGCYLKGKKLWGKVYITNYSFDADFKVYFTNYSFDANLKVWNAPYSFSPSGCGQWYITKYSFDADFKIYVTKYPFDADLKIYTTNYSFDAGLP